MSTFDQLQSKNGIGVAYVLNVSIDGFSSIFKSYSTVAVDGQAYDPRIEYLGRLQRGLQPQFAIGAGTIQVILDNTDAGVDWLVTQQEVETELLQAEFQLYMLLFDPLNPTDYQTKDLGRWTCLDFPQRDAGRVTLSIADQAFGPIAELARTPSINDWVNDSGSTTTNCPLVTSTGGGISPFYTLLDVVDMNAPVRLAFGHRPLPGIRVCEGYDTTPANFYKRVLMVCATADTSADPTPARLFCPSLGTALAGGKLGQQGTEIPQSTTVGHAPGTIWTIATSQTIAKDGKNWKLIFVVINFNIFRSWVDAVLRPTAQQAFVTPDWASSEWTVQCRLFSSVTFTNPTTPSPDGSITVTPSQVAYDLLVNYSRSLDSGDVDGASFDAVTGARPMLAACGTIEDSTSNPLNSGNLFFTGTSNLQNTPRVESVGGRMRDALSELCRSGQFDITTKWDGTFQALGPMSSFAAQTSALVSLDEELVVEGSWIDRVPSVGERWSPYNRIYVRDPDGTQVGPFDAKDYSLNVDKIEQWGIVLPYTLSSSWVWYSDFGVGSTAIWTGGGFEARVRPVIKFRYSIEAMALELGQLVQVTWSRASSLPAAYSQTIFRVEGLTLIPESCEVEIVAIWFGDIRNQPPYLLDEESYTLRVGSVALRTVTVEDGSDIVDFSAGNLISDGVLPGDILMLLDGTQADDVYTRRRCLRILAVSGAGDELQVTDADLDFDASSPVAVTTWEILRGATTYPDAGSDPTHYPLGSSMYGKVTDLDGLDSNGDQGNQLLDG